MGRILVTYMLTPVHTGLAYLNNDDKKVKRTKKETMRFSNRVDSIDKGGQ